jgi:quinol monooxygenase YgiN
MTTVSWGYLLIWEFQIKQTFEPQFQIVYGSEGEWANFFRQDPNYCGTDLVRDLNQPGRYVTLDYWTSRAAYENFRLQHADEYKKIDHRCAEMTEREVALGAYERIA